MTISYKWLCQYLPFQPDPQRLSEMLTSAGLEVEKMENFEEIKGGLEGLVIGEVLETSAHPNADKLKLAKVDTGSGEPLQIVCGAPNVAAGQKVVVAPVGATIFPVSGDPVKMKLAKIRGVESQGMICAEDEIGMGESHAGIMVLPADLKAGTKAAEYFNPHTDIVYHIGLTPNRMDAMSHMGVARDICAYVSHHEEKRMEPVFPEYNFKADEESLPVDVHIENNEACRRYSGVSISGVEVKTSPQWLQQQLKSIGLRPINNIVDITNFIQHETGQPLHAFDLDTISQRKIIVKTLPAGTEFITLDEKTRKLHEDDLMICDADAPMCIAGVFGGMSSGVTAATKNIFLESAWFDPVYIRKTSFRHGLRTDAATRFEKGTDISCTVQVLERAAMLVKEVAGGKIASNVVDEYPSPLDKKNVLVKYDYLHKISGKIYPPAAVKNILASLGFEISDENENSIMVAVPYHKPDIALPADIAEEILRIDGLDNIPIPEAITIVPSPGIEQKNEDLKEKMAQVCMGLGFSEILTNSITNSDYFNKEELSHSVQLLNNLSSELDMLRPSMLHTALGVIAFNLNRRNSNLRLFEFGKTYRMLSAGAYDEAEHFALYITGNTRQAGWNQAARPADIYYVKGVATALLKALGIDQVSFEPLEKNGLAEGLAVKWKGEILLETGKVSQSLLTRFDIKQPVYFIDLYWQQAVKFVPGRISFREIPKYPSVERDLAMVVAKDLQYAKVEEQLQALKLKKLKEVRLFDVFESDKLGAGKKSLAINLTFMDEEKTLTDKEIEGWMLKIMNTLEKELQAEIRKQ